jgi:AcrR family transcriptional regulator
VGPKTEAGSNGANRARLTDGHVVGEVDSQGATQSRAATEKQLEEAALELLEQNGVLAGINLREVADLASVNRGLVYHYFGSRQRLLRAALSRRAAAFQGDLERIWALPFRDRSETYLAIALKHATAIALKTILLLDKDERVRMLPMWRTSRETYARDIADGLLAEGTDLEAMQAVLVSLVTGYVVHRDAFADELGVEPEELDARVRLMLLRALDGLAGTGAEVSLPPPSFGVGRQHRRKAMTDSREDERTSRAT